MKNLKTTIFSVTLLGTTFVALGYFCKWCGTDHRYLMDCPAYNCGIGEASDTIVKEYVVSLVKDEIKHCRNAGEARRIISEINGLLNTKELEMRYSEILGLLHTQKSIEETRKGLEDVSKAMINHSINRDCGFCFDDEILNWSEVFGSDCETAPALTNHRDSWNEGSNEPDPWDSRHSSSPFGC